MNDALARVLPSAADSSRPWLTWYSPDERIELTGHVLSMWHAKCAGFLTAEAGPGARVHLGMTPHWRTVTWCAGAWLAGATPVLLDSGDSFVENLLDEPPSISVAFRIHWLFPSADVQVLVTMGSLATHWPTPLPPLTLDGIADVMPFSDHFPPAPANTGEPPAAVENHRALQRAVTYIDSSFRERITLDRLARRVGFSPGYLSQVFHQQVGMTFSEYLTRVRLRQATRDLGETDHLIARVAADAGFPDVKAFNTAFRRTFGRTPSAYRSLLTTDTAAADEVFHQRYVSRGDESVMRVLRVWASRGAAGGAEGPCATATLLARPSPVEEALELTRSLTARLEQMADGG